MSYMPEKKPNVLREFLSAFQRKKPVYEDIVTVADKVIEDYIFSRSKLLRKAYAPKKSRPFLWWGTALVAVICTIILLT